MKKMTRHFLTAGALVATAGLLALYEHYLPPFDRAGKTDHTKYGLLLGCPNRKDGRISQSQKKRAAAAVEAWRSGLFETLIISGGAAHSKQVEAEVLEQLVHQQESDLPVLLETEAKTTWQNLQFTKEMIGDQPLIIITSGLHCRRAAAMARQFFSSFEMVPAFDPQMKLFLREIPSRALYIKIELEKKFSPSQKDQDESSSSNSGS